MKTPFHPRFGILAGMILLAALSRLLPHPPNVTPVGAMALFGGAYFTRRIWAFLVPLASMWLSDLIINNIVYKEYNPAFTWIIPDSLWVYGSLLLIAGVGSVLLTKVKPVSLLTASVAASVLFFVLTNFGTWYLYKGITYPDSWAGLVACYTAAIPFFGNTLAGDLFFCAVLFGGFEIARRRFPTLALRPVGELR